MAKYKQFAVLGIGRFGYSLAKTLMQRGYEVMAVDTDVNIIEDISEFVTHAVVADATDEQALRAIGISNFDVVVIAMATSFEATILSTLLVKELGNSYVLVKAKDESEAKILHKIGADKVILPEADMGERVALSLISNNVLDSIELSDSYSIVEIHPLQQWIGNKISDLNIRSEYGLNILAINRDKKIMVIIDPETIVEKEDVLVSLGDRSSIEKFIRRSQGLHQG